MRLYLSSFRMGNHPEEILSLTSGKRAAVIANATDDIKSPNERVESVQLEINNLSDLGLEAQEIDLRDYFGKANDLSAKLAEFDFIWVRGGNVFILRRALKLSGFDVILKDLLLSDKVAYGGYSAGIDILQPHLHGIELVDDPSIVPTNYSTNEIIWDCLNLLPYCVAPHYKSDHPESSDIDKTVEFYIENHIPFIALKDGQAIVVNGDQEKVVI